MRLIRPCASRAGVTLIELIVALAILGVILGVSTAALSAVHREVPLSAVFAAARSRALRTGTAVRVEIPDSTGRAAPTDVLLLPDGRAVGGGLDPLTGQVSDAKR